MTWITPLLARTSTALIVAGVVVVSVIVAITGAVPALMVMSWPATVVTAEQIQNTGIVNIETALQRLPANAGFAGNQTSAYWTNNGYGTAQVNLRGLGIKRYHLRADPLGQVVRSAHR